VQGISSVQISYTCSHCDQAVSAPLTEATQELPCPHCGGVLETPRGAVSADNLHRCVVCPSEELYARKDFSQRLGVGIVVVGIVLSTITWYYHQIYLTYGIFFGTALIDFVLWLVMGNVLQCYRCQAQYRGVAGLDDHGGFDLETHEKHRQQLARLAEAQAVPK
jgi:DNA-directed RNA polymerase subunit RPC12/RpoP